MSKEKTVVITAHGKVVKNKFKPPIDVITTCKLGEPHAGSLTDFNKLYIFDKPEYLYKHILKGDNYLNTGTVWNANEEIYDIELTPIKTTDPVKRFSWQKPYITEHLTKLCRYELWENPIYKDIITPFNIADIKLNDILGEANKNKDLSLLSSYRITTSYDTNYILKNPVYINGHICSLTYNKSRTVNIIEYEEKGMFSLKEEWSFSAFLDDINDYAKSTDSELIGYESVVLKACLS